eukprot:CAMPEP_0185467656 /NCGR_PEP_ID=MMETSP1365-20130426/97338_1 /TAXON_ID=38817 /ORGANISM="Gephyrocapsa oceanica, Strain RCC1303" /LENGTH=562 /DNA_ID=CAMNT_0028074393 /DNA_START=211 /DNA_END=1898 /DNA_ORIENTATION=+
MAATAAAGGRAPVAGAASAPREAVPGRAALVSGRRLLRVGEPPSRSRGVAAEGGVPQVAAPELVGDGRRSSAARQSRLQSGDGGVDPRDRALGLGGREVVERAAAAARVERSRLGRVPPNVVEALPRHRGGALAGARGEVQLVVAAARSPQAGAPPPVAAAAGAGRASKEEEAAVRARLAPPGQERAEVPPVEQLRARSPAREPDSGGEHVQQRGHGGRHAAGRHGARQVRERGHADTSLVRRELAAPQRARRASRGGHLHPWAVVGREERQRAARRAGLRDDPAQLADRLVHLEQRVAVAPRGRPVAEAGRWRERHVRLVEGDEEEPRLGAAGGGEHKLGEKERYAAVSAPMSAGCSAIDSLASSGSGSASLSCHAEEPMSVEKGMPRKRSKPWSPRRSAATLRSLDASATPRSHLGHACPAPSCEASHVGGEGDAEEAVKAVVAGCVPRRLAEMPLSRHGRRVAERAELRPNGVLRGRQPTICARSKGRAVPSCAGATPSNRHPAGQQRATRRRADARRRVEGREASPGGGERVELAERRLCVRPVAPAHVVRQKEEQIW